MAERGVASAARRDFVEADAPGVSVVITCYNQAHFLADAIESVLGQSRRADEIVVVDDGSTDDARAVAMRYPGVPYLRQRNAGSSSARNVGLGAARGRYVVFLDADDRLLPEAVEAGVAAIEAHPACGMVSGHYRMISADGSPIPSESRPCVERNHYLELLRGNYIGMHAAVLYRREVLEQEGAFDSTLPACEDYDLYLRIARRWPIHCHDKVVAEYRWHGANMSKRRRLMLRTALRALRGQRENVRGKAELEAAYANGVRSWQRMYGDPLLAETLAALRNPKKWRSAALGLGTVLRHYPRGLWAGLVDKLVPVRASRPPTLSSRDSVPPRVSVIIPCFNQACYLGEAIESALDQRGPSLEVVVVDDGSTDATRSVAESFGVVRYIHQKNRGTAAARNRGFRESRGEFIVFLDADDRLLPGAAEIGVRQLDEQPDCGFVHGHVRRIARDGSSLGTPVQDCMGEISYLSLLRQNSIWTPGSVLYRRGACEQARGFRPAAGGSADVDLNLRIARRWKVRCHGALVAEYRVYPESQSGDPGLMLRSAVWARRSQRVALPDGSDFLQALREGIRAVQRDYGGRLLTRLRREVAAGQWKRAISDFWTLVRYDPARVVRLVRSRRT